MTSNVRGIDRVRLLADAEAREDMREEILWCALADGQSLSEEFVLADLQDARAAFEEITGKRRVASANQRIPRPLDERDVPHVRDLRPISEELDIQRLDDPPSQFLEPLTGEGGHSH